jgi:hypothetical protein
MSTVEWSTTVRVNVGALELAQIFCEMDDDAQAQFFIEVARIFNGWPGNRGSEQARYIANHMRTCECSTEAARELVRGIAEAFDHNTGCDV